LNLNFYKLDELRLSLHKKAKLLQGELRDAAVNFDTYQILP